MKTLEKNEKQLTLDCVNTLRCLAMDAVQKANSGHPGTPMELAPIAYVLWTKHLRFNPKNPYWPNRDRVILSCGHACMLLYSVLHLTGYEISLDDIKNFRQWESITPGHSEHGVTPGVEATTGPLGQGVSNAVGMAMAERYLAALFNRPNYEIIDHHTYAICSDGDIMEGVAQEAASLAGHLGLHKLIALYSDNHITIDGDTALTFSEDVGKRYEAYGWFVQRVDGNDLTAIDHALTAAKAQTQKPSLIIARTHIAYGSPNKQDTADAHGAPLGEEEVALTKKNLGWDPDKHFYIPEAVAEKYRTAIPRGAELELEWDKHYAAYAKTHHQEAALYHSVLKQELPHGWDKNLPSFPAGEKLATRQASGKTLHELAKQFPTLIGGSADLSGSCNTEIKGSGNFEKGAYQNRNLRFGVREHAMGAILNGLSLHGGVRPFGSTFLIFSDYMRPSVRLAALTELPVIYVYTHDSIGLGEDGPTHQPIEHLSSLRAMPNLRLIRPCDANETVEAWRQAMLREDGPTAIILTRQALPVLDRTQFASASLLSKGAYILSEASDPKKIQIILIATGSEIHPALEAQKLLQQEGLATRVVSMPCWDLFEQQPEAYQESVLPSQITARIAIEAAATHGWEKWVGLKGKVIGMKRFGASAPGPVVMKHFGFTPQNIAAQAKLLTVLK